MWLENNLVEVLFEHLSVISYQSQKRYGKMVKDQM